MRHVALQWVIICLCVMDAGGAVGWLTHAQGDGDESHAERFHNALLATSLLSAIAKIEDGPDPYLRQRLKPRRGELATAIKMLVDLLELLYPGRIRGCQVDRQDQGNSWRRRIIVFR